MTSKTTIEYVGSRLQVVKIAAEGSM